MTQVEGSTLIEANLELKKPVPEAEAPSKPTDTVTATAETEDVAVVVGEDVKNGTKNGTASSSLTVSDQLLRQIEYYFGDVNLPHDKFIKTELAKLEGWFPIELLLKFNKVNQILTGVQDDEKLKQIVLATEGSALVELNETKDKIRRNPEVPIVEDASDRRTIYLKGFHKTETKIDNLIEHFKKYEGMDAVIMRYYKEKVLLAQVPEIKKEEKSDAVAGTDVVDNAPNPLAKYAPVADKIVHVKKFKGSIFVVFKTEELAKAALDDITTYCGNDLLKMMQYEYIEKKKKEYEERQSRKRTHADVKKEEEEEKEEAYEEDPSGIFVKLTGIPNDFSREKIKENWYKTFDENKFELAFIDFQKGDTEAILRLTRGNSAVEALESLKDKDSQLPIDDGKFLAVGELDEEAEKKYRVKVKENRKNYKQNRGRGGYNRGGRGGRGQRGGRGRKRGRYN